MSVAGRSEREVERPANLASIDRAGADADEEADHPPHHLPEEVRADDAHEHQRAGFLDRHRGDGHGGRLLLGIVVGERREVLHAGERGGAGAHLTHVERIAHPPHERLGERGAPPRDLVQVAAGGGVVAGVEPVRHDLDAADVDVGGQRLVDPRQQRRRRQRRADVEMRDLGQRVDAGVGAAGAVDLEAIAAGRGADRLDQLALDRPRVGLDLPAAVARAGVLDGQLEAGHGVQAKPPPARLTRPASAETAMRLRASCGRAEGAAATQ